MRKIDVTHRIRIVDLGEDEEFGHMAEEDHYFVVKGLPAEHVSAFWTEVMNLPGCTRRSVREGAREDDRLRIDWNDYRDDEDFLRAKEKILETIKRLVPDAKVRYRQLGSGFIIDGDYDPEDEMLLVGAFSDEEREYLTPDQRAEILHISRRQRRGRDLAVPIETMRHPSVNGA